MENPGFHSNDQVNGNEYHNSGPRLRNQSQYATASPNGKRDSSLDIHQKPVQPHENGVGDPPKETDQSAEDEPNYEDSFEDLEWEPTSFISRILLNIQLFVKSLLEKTKGKSNYIIFGTIFILYNAYLATAVAYHVRHDDPILWCDGLGFLIVITGLVYWGLLYYHIIKPFFGKTITENVFKPIDQLWQKCWNLLLFRLLFGLVIVGGIITFLVIDTKDNRRRLVSAAGIPIFIFVGLLLSKHPSRVVWRHIFWGTAIQFVFGFIILRWEFGKDIFNCMSDKIATFLDFTVAGSSFVFGYLATGYDSTNEGVELNKPIILNSTFAFGALSVVFFFSFIVGILYSTGVMIWVITKLGWLLQISMGTTAAESMSAAANIFLGQTEAPLVVKPYLKDLTNSELHAIMTGGFATIAGTVMGAFISFGIPASHLLSASFMSAPAALAFSKLIYPETKISRTTADQIYARRPKSTGSFVDAATNATSQAVYLVANIIASLVAVTAFVSFMDAILNWFGVLVGFDEFDFQWILAKVFYPVAFVIGIDPEEIEVVARLLGIKTVINEFQAYMDLSTLSLSPRSTAIATYALCSFSNFSSIGIQLGGIGAMEPKRKRDLANMVWRAFIAGNAAALMTACVAGTLMSEPGYNSGGYNETLF